jgi:ubiquinol-cytochrome c reductase cytochrome c subunit
MSRAARLLGSWWRRPARTPRWLRMLIALGLISVDLVAWATPVSSGAGTPTPPAGHAQLPTGPLAGAGGPPVLGPAAPDKSPEPPGPGASTTSFPTSGSLVSQGMTLYENGCSACHGTLLQGRPGQAPSLQGVGPGPVDFYLSTGRMPLQAPTDEPERTKPVYDRPQIDAIIAFITRYGGGPPAPAADPSKGDISLGQQLFTDHCAGCHQALGRGGMTIGAYVPNLQLSSPREIAEAVRMGPYLMPHFDAKQIDQHELDSIARYVLWTRRPADDGGWGIYNLGPIPEGIVTWFIALVAVVMVARVIGERTA